MRSIFHITALLILSLVLFSSCKKFLEGKSDQKLSVPATIEDYQAMLNNYADLNTNFCAAGEISADDYYIGESNFKALYYESDKRLYSWQPDNVARTQSSAGDEWFNCYKSINICNTIIKGLKDNNLTGVAAGIAKGQALVFRAARYLDGTQIWTPAYNKQTAGTDLGMVLRLIPDINIPSVRSSLQQTYDLIIQDLTEAASLLPTDLQGATLPTKSAAYGLLARTYLFMGEYDKAMINAENAIKYSKAQVLDFNTLDPSAIFPIPAPNYMSQEVVLYASLFYADPLDQSIVEINPSLYNLYENGDLRKEIYFGKNPDSSIFFKGTHLGYYGLINSLTPAELILTSAECNARLGNPSKAATELNQLLIKRYKKGVFIPYTFPNSSVALSTILNERRKELTMRGLRWPEIKRLNRDGYNITLTRTIGNLTYTLPPNDPRYAIAIPEAVIKTAKIQQNPR